MNNPFDQFDSVETSAVQNSSNPFDRFDEVARDPDAVNEKINSAIAERQGAGERGFVNNAVRGAGERASSLAGDFIESGAALNEQSAYSPVMPSLSGVGNRPQYVSPEDRRAQREEANQRADKMRNVDLGYDEKRNTIDGAKSKYEKGDYLGAAYELWSAGNEMMITSAPDMLGSAAIPLNAMYLQARSGEIAQANAKNQGKERADDKDIAQAVPFALASALLERILPGRIFRGAGEISEEAAKEISDQAIRHVMKKTASEAGQSAAIEGGTEFIQEGVIEYVGQRYGTDAEMSVREALSQGAEAMVLGAIGGSTMGGAKGAYEGVSDVRQAGQMNPAVDPEPNPDIQPEITENPIGEPRLPEQGDPVLWVSPDGERPAMFVGETEGPGGQTFAQISIDGVDSYVPMDQLQWGQKPSPLNQAPDDVEAELSGDLDLESELASLMMDLEGVQRETDALKADLRANGLAMDESGNVVPDPNAIEFVPPNIESGNGLSLAPLETAYEGGIDFQSQPNTAQRDQLAAGVQREIDAYIDQRVDEYLPEGMKDRRLMRERFRVDLDLMAKELVKGGNVGYTYDEHGRINGRTGSINPPWFKSLDGLVTTDEAKKAVGKALAGEKLGTRQAALIETMLDEISLRKREETQADIVTRWESRKTALESGDAEAITAKLEREQDHLPDVSPTEALLSEIVSDAIQSGVNSQEAMQALEKYSTRAQGDTQKLLAMMSGWARAKSNGQQTETGTELQAGTDNAQRGTSAESAGRADEQESSDFGVDQTRATEQELTALLNPFDQFDGEEVAIAVDVAASEAATSPDNSLPEPTPAQKEAGNYKKAHIKIQGLDIAIENPRGSMRSGIAPDGKKWEVAMKSHYGYIKRTEGADGEHVDVFIGPNPESEKVFIVDQVNADGSFDEHKILIGWDSKLRARSGYKANYTNGWKVGPITSMTMDEFKAWVKSGDTKKPLQPDHFRGAKKMVAASEKPIENKAVADVNDTSVFETKRKTQPQKGIPFDEARESVFGAMRGYASDLKRTYEDIPLSPVATDIVDATEQNLRRLTEGEIDAIASKHGVPSSTVRTLATSTYGWDYVLSRFEYKDANARSVYEEAFRRSRAPSPATNQEPIKSAARVKSEPAPVKPSANQETIKKPLPAILTETKAQTLKKMAAEQGIKKGSPGYADAMARLTDEYETEVDRAQAALPFEQFNELNSDTPESINRQAYDALREEYGIAEEKSVEKIPAEKLPDETNIETDAYVRPESEFDYQKELADRINDGEVTIEEFKAAFESLVSGRSEIIAELSTLTKPALIAMLDPVSASRVKSEKKEYAIGRAYEELVKRFYYTASDSGMMSISMNSRDYIQNYIDTARPAVEAATQKTLDGHAKKVADAKRDRDNAKKEKAKGIEDPKTLEDYRNLHRSILAENKDLDVAAARMKMTPAQRAEYDNLAAAESRDKRIATKTEKKVSVSSAGQVVGGEIIETKHTKKGHDLFVVQLEERVSKEDYGTLSDSAKRLGGYYSSFRGVGAVPGFQFPTKESAQAFLELAGGNAEPAASVAKERSDAFEDDKSQSTAQRLRAMAAAMDERAENELTRDRKSNTTRRAGMAARALESAERSKAMADTMQKIAAGIESGSLKLLDGVRAYSHLEQIQSAVTSAKGDELRAKYGSYSEQLKHQGEPATAETADYAVWPMYTAYRSDLAKLARQMIETDGLKKLGNDLLKAADDTSAEYLKFAKENLHKVSTFVNKDGGTAAFKTKKAATLSIEGSGFSGKAIPLEVKRGENLIILSASEAMSRGIWQGEDKKITLNPDFASELIEKAARKNRKSQQVAVPWQFETVRDRRRRYSAMGIETAAELRAALREYISLMTPPKETDQVRKLELAMVGRKKDGLDFFPTPSSVADEMVSVAEIQDGMSVLEPSAGMGHIADRIRASGVEPDVIEISGDRRELLEAKGYSLVGSDFMEFEAGGTAGYDRIIMNPPFSDRRDMEHVLHAYKLLKPGGRIVAIVGEGVMFGSDKKAVSFRDWLEELGASTEKLEDGTFNDPSLPVTTGVSARMLVIDKPESESAFSLSNNRNATTASTSGTVSEADANKVIARIRAGIANKGLDIKAVDSFAAFPDEVKAQAEREGHDGKNVEGVFHKGAIYVNRAALTDSAGVERVIFHELYGHYGLRKMFGGVTQQAMGSLYLAVGGAKGINDLSKKHNIDLRHYARGLKDSGARRETLQAVMMEELLAHIAQSSKPSVTRRLKEMLGRLRGWLRKAGFIRTSEVTDSELMYLLRQARDAVRTGADGRVDPGTFMAVSQPMFSIKADSEPRPQSGASVLDKAKDLLPGAAERKARGIERAKLNPSTQKAFDQSGNKDQTIIQKIRREAKRQLTPSGLLPDDVYRLKIERDSQLNADEIENRVRVKAFNDAVEKAYGKPYDKLGADTKAKLNAALKGEAVTVPEAIRAQMDLMRDEIKRFSNIHIRQLINEVKRLTAQGKDSKAREKLALLQTISENLDTYLHRSYRAFDDENWPKKVPPKVFGDAVEFLAKQYADGGPVTAEHRARAEKKAYQMLHEGTAFDSMSAFISEGKLGAKDLSIIKRRKDISPEIRALLGEYEDAPINYVKSATKMARLVYNHEFLTKLQEVGFEQGFLFDQENTELKATKQIAGDGSEVYAPLNGLYTYPEFDQALRDALGKENMAGWYRTLIAANGMVKFGKTVLSPTTAMRNFYSAFFFSMANGHFDLRKVKDATSIMRTYFTHSDDGGKEYMKKLRRLGVVYDSPYASEMMELLKDSRLEDTALQWKPLSGVKGAIDYAQKFYSFGDDFWKIIGFENEKALLMKHKKMNEAEAETEAAERIRNTYPTYSMTGRFVNSLRRFPLVGTFVSFPAEIIRTSYHITRYMAKDLKESRAMGMQKLAGFVVAAAAIQALSLATKAMLGVDDDEEAALRKLAPEWQRNSSFLYWGRDDKGALQYLDLSFLDPYNYWKRPINALLRDQPLDEAVVDGAKEMLMPFFGQDIAFGAIMESANNKKGSGGRVFNPEDDAINQTLDISAHLAKAFQPGIASNLQRIYQASQGKVSASGKKFTMQEEMAALAGFRMGTFDPKTALYYQSFGFMDRKRNASMLLSQAARDPNKTSDSDLKDAYERSMKARERAYGDMINVVNAAKKAGMSHLQILTTLRNSGITMKDARSLARGEIPPWKPSKTMMQGAIKKASILFDNETAEEFKRRERLIKAGELK